MKAVRKVLDMETKETHKRSIAKSITWRVLASLTTMILVFVFTQRLDIMVAVGGIEIIAKMLIYYAHERAWNVTKWGKAGLSDSAKEVTER
jgi:adenylylsulfate kinase